MRTLVYGMQSSGASWVAYCLGQTEDTIVIPDIYYFRAVPLAKKFGEHDVVLKTTVDLKHTLEEARARFQPSRTVIVVRDEDAVRNSLRRRAKTAERDWAFMRHGEPEMERKLAEMRRVIGTPELWDERIDYETFEPPQLTRSLEEIIRYNWENCQWCRGNALPQLWGLGGIRIPGMSTDEASRLSHMVRRGPPGT